MSKSTATRQLSETDLLILKAMRPDIEEYLRKQGWVFAGVSQPDHKRQWAQMDGDKVKRVALESELEDLALEIISDR